VGGRPGVEAGDVGLVDEPEELDAVGDPRLRRGRLKLWPDSPLPATSRSYSGSSVSALTACWTPLY